MRADSPEAFFFSDSTFSYISRSTGTVQEGLIVTAAVGVVVAAFRVVMRSIQKVEAVNQISLLLSFICVSFSETLSWMRETEKEKEGEKESMLSHGNFAFTAEEEVEEWDERG